MNMNRKDTKDARKKIWNAEEIATQIVDAAIKVHRALGPGLLESAYQQCFAHELRQRGLKVETEVVLPIAYEGLQIDAGYRIDMLIEQAIVVENKAVEQLTPIHAAQLLTYLKLRDCRLGFLLNWNVVLMKQGIKRMINNPPETSRPQAKS
jgi:GxxExxY protein